MAAVDVLSEITIARPPAEVAAFASDPDNATRWYVNIKSVAWKTPAPAVIGSQIAFTAQFLGRKLEYTYEVVDLVPGERFAMRTAQGPFPMETTYEFTEAGGGTTRMTLRNRGEPAGFASLTAALTAQAMRRANRKDLARLKSILEAG